MPERRDFLAICNDQGVPLADFQTTFCVRCVQPECSRSRAGGLFETRVATWEERLFKNPPRVSKDEALYEVLAAKRFVDVDTGRVPEVRGPSEWVDPRVLTDGPARVEEPPRPARPPRPTVVGAESSIREPEARPVGPRAPLNTPFVQGTMLDGTPVAAAKPDRWSVAPPSTPEAASPPVVKAGAKIKFTGG